MVLSRKGQAARARRPAIRLLPAGEDGASYSLPFLMILPLYTILICIIVEIALMTGVKVGTLYSAYAAARSAAVWLPAEIPAANRRGMIHLAAIAALWPIASGAEQHALAGEGSFPLDSRAEEAAGDCIAAYRQYTGHENPPDYLRRKWFYAAKATEVEIALEPRRVDDAFSTIEMAVTVQYEMPLNTSCSGWLLGRSPSWPGCPFRTRKIASTVVLEEENLKSIDQSNPRLGIRYDQNPGFTTRGVAIRYGGDVAGRR
jgi:hypothetical protein